MQAALVALVENVPTVQGLQTELPAPAMPVENPAPQSVQSALVVLVEYLPEAHRLHTELPALAMPVDEPARQLVQLEPPEVAENVPTAQATQAETSVLFVNPFDVPARHAGPSAVVSEQ